MDYNTGFLIIIFDIKLFVFVKALTCLHSSFLRKNRLIQQKELLSENRWLSRFSFGLELLISSFRATTGNQ